MIRNQQGLFSNGAFTPRFAKTGKVWDSFGKARAAILRSDQSHYARCEIIAIDIVPVDRRRCDLLFTIERIATQRCARTSLRTLFERLYAAGEQLTFPHGLVIDVEDGRKSGRALLAHLTEMGLNKKEIRWSGNAFAFADRNQAALARLAVTGKAIVVDFAELI